MKPTTFRLAAFPSSRIWPILPLLAVSTVFVAVSAFADGCFVFRWNKQKDINEPTQKAIILHDQGREDLVLQVKYEGPAEDFGWLIPVPGKPEVRKGSMQPFYELSRLTQERFGDVLYRNHYGLASAGLKEEAVKVIEIRTVGAYEVAILSTTDGSALADWLAAHEFNFPKEKQSVLDEYVQKHWYFVAVRINPSGNGFALKSAGAKPDHISAVTRTKLASGELHPIIISFPSEKCIFPLAISSVNGKPSEISLYILSTDPLLSPLIYDRTLKACESEKDEWSKAQAERMRHWSNRYANIFRRSPLGDRMMQEDPNDPPPESAFGIPGPAERGLPPRDERTEDFYRSRAEIVHSMHINVRTNALKACGHDLPRLGEKQWWLTKLTETFRPAEMVDLQFDAVLPFLGARLREEDGEAAARCLPQYRSSAVPVILAALNNSDTSVRRRALDAVSEFSDPAFVEPLLGLLNDSDAEIRVQACYATHSNWSPRFVQPLLRLIHDPDPRVVNAAQDALNGRAREVSIDAATLRNMLDEDGPASALAVHFLRQQNETISRAQLVRLLSYTNLASISMALSELRSQLDLDAVAPLMTNSLPLARQFALGFLRQIGDKAAVDRIVSMLHDPNESIRWRARSAFRQLTAQRLGADPAAYETWWTENRDNYTPKPSPTLSRNSR